MPRKEKLVSIAVTQTLHDKIKAVAKANGRTISGHVRWLMRDDFY